MQTGVKSICGPRPTKPQVVDKRGVIFRGNEILQDVYCCEWSKSRIASLQEREQKAFEFANMFDQPRTHGGVVYMMTYRDNDGSTKEYVAPKLTLNYCPFCGTPYED